MSKEKQLRKYRKLNQDSYDKLLTELNNWLVAEELSPSDSAMLCAHVCGLNVAFGSDGYDQKVLQQGILMMGKIIAKTAVQTAKVVREEIEKRTN